jgi:hypothetical protein
MNISFRKYAGGVVHIRVDGKRVGKLEPSYRHGSMYRITLDYATNSDNFYNGLDNAKEAAKKRLEDSAK